MMATSSKSTKGRVDKRGERLGLAGEKHDPSDQRTGEGEGGEKEGVVGDEAHEMQCRYIQGGWRL